MGVADLFDKPVELGGALAEPDKRLFADRVVLRVPRFDISLIQRVEPGTVALLIARPGFREPPVLLFCKCPKKSQLVRRRAVVGQDKQQRCIDVLNRLM